jgi:hypothetical protein
VAIEVGAGPLSIDAAATGAAALDDALVSAEALLLESTGSAEHDPIANIASRVVIDAIRKKLTPNLGPNLVSTLCRSSTSY